MLIVKYGKLIVMFVILINILFTGIILYMFWRTGDEPRTLIGSWFLFTTGELWALSRITVEEKKGEKAKHESYNREPPI